MTLTTGTHPPIGGNRPKLPHSVDAERECLGAAIVSDSVIEKLARLLEPADFYVERHRLMYEAMLDLRNRGVQIDVVTLHERLRDRGHGARVSSQHVGELLDLAGTSTLVEHYAHIVRAKAALRAMIQTGQSLEVAGYQGDDYVEGALVAAAHRLRESTERLRADGLQLAAWSVKHKFQGEAPAVDWLIPDMIARGEAHLLASPGDGGKGFMCINLALQLASGVRLARPRAPLGQPIMSAGRKVPCVLLFAEDSEGAVHRRLNAMDADGWLRGEAGDNLIILPMPSVGGAFSVLERDAGGSFHPTKRWLAVREQLKAIPDLGLVCLDPLSAWLSIDIDKDSAAAQAWAGEMATLASDTGAAVLFTHHMRKASADTGKAPAELPTHESVRESIRGVAALINGVRMAFGFVPMPGRWARLVLDKLGERGDVDVGKVFWGAVVKANGRTDRRERLFVRAPYGLLEDRTADIVQSGSLNDALRQLAKEAA